MNNKLKIIFAVTAVISALVFSGRVYGADVSSGVDLELTKSVEIIYPTTTTSTQTFATTSEIINIKVPPVVYNLDNSKKSTTASSSNLLTSLSLKVFSSPEIAQAAAVVNTVVVVPLTIFFTGPSGLWGALAGIGSLADLWLVILRLWYALLTLLGLRKKRKPWGTVYDSQTKQPLDPVIVTLFDAISGQKVDQVISDLAGRFGFLAQPGRYIITAQKTHYLFPSKNIPGNSDGIFANLYHGEVIALASETDVVSPNIPMDPLAFDWNQQDKQRLVKVHPRLEYSFNLIFSTVFWVAIVLTLMGFFASPNPLTIFLLAASLVVVIIKLLPIHNRLWGRLVNSGTSLPLAGFILKLSPEAIPDVVVAKALVSSNGRFFLKANPGRYSLSILDSQGNMATRGLVTLGKDGLLTEDLAV